MPVGLGVFNKLRFLLRQDNTWRGWVVHRMARASFSALNLDVSARAASGDPAENTKTFSKHVETFRTALAVARAGGGAKAIERHTQRHNKMVVEDRVKALLDQDSPFLELSPLAGFQMEYGTIPRASMVTGVGYVSGKLCMILANDGAVKGGSVYPITIKKQLRAQEIAQQNLLPCIYVVDSGGAFLPMQSDIFPDKNHGGRAFYNEAVMSAAHIPQIAVVCGSCTAGGAYIPTMADEAVIVHKTGSVFLGGPPLVKAALGEMISAEDLGGATLHCSVSGCTDYFAPDEKSAYEICRDIIATLNIHHNEIKGRLPSALPLYDPKEIPSFIPSTDQHKLDMYQVIGRLVDRSLFHEFKKMYGPTLLTGFAHLDGYLVGIVGNQGEITSDAASKGAHFVTLCNERGIPIIFLQNTWPEKDPGADVQTDQLKCQAQMMAVVSCCSIPKITVLVGNGVGPAHYLMGGKAMSPNFLFSWPNAVRCMESTHYVLEALRTNLSLTIQDEEKRREILVKSSAKIEFESSAVCASSCMLDDGIILPEDTRQVLSQCLSIVSAYKEPSSPLYPVIRM